MTSSNLILLAHGSKDPDWAKPMEDLLARLKSRHPGRAYLAYLQFCEPSFADVLKKAASQGADLIRVLPVFLSSGGHVQRDIVPLIQQMGEESSTRIELLPAIGETSEFHELLFSLAACHLQGTE